MKETSEPQREARRFYSAETWIAAHAAYLDGATVEEIEARHGIKRTTVRNRAWRKGWRRLRPQDAPAAAPLVSTAWADLAHEAQRAPDGQWSTWLFQGGRGAGKTRAGAEWLAARAEASPNGLFALVGPTQHDVREVMIDGVSGVRNLPNRPPPRYEQSRRRLIWPNGATAYAFSAEEPERLRGPQFEAAWADEFCAWPKPEHTLALLRMGLRLGNDPRLVVTTTPKPVAALRRLRAEPSCVVTQAASIANAANLAPSFLDGLRVLYGGTRFAAQELEGLLVEDLDAALWRAEDLQRCRGGAPAALDRVIVAVDPPAGVGGSACGVIVAGRRDARGYILADRSVSGLSPYGWASRVAESARSFGAVEIVAEANQGGDMVRATLASAGAPCAIRLVHASRGKRARAEPVAALYEQGRVTHCGVFSTLEEELMALGAGAEDGRFDRADALVWALTALMLEPSAQPRVSVI